MLLKKIFYTAIIPAALTMTVLVTVNQYCVSQTEKYYPTSGVNHLFDNKVKDKGLALLNLSVKNNHIILFGTSEFNTDPSYHIVTNPIDMFPNQYINRDVDITGSGGSETLVSLIRMGAIDNIENVPIVFNSSPSWYEGRFYIKSGLLSWFSELQYYAFMENGKISPELKGKVSAELARLLRGNSNFHEAFLFAKLHSKEIWYYRFARLMLSPYFVSRKQFLKFKDNINAYLLVKKYKGEYVPKIHKINWENERKRIDRQVSEYVVKDKAHEIGFFAYQKWEDYYKKKKYTKDKNSRLKIPIDISNEYMYHDWMLQMASGADMKLLVSITSFNGYVMDHWAMTYDKRKLYYDKLVALQQKYNVDYLDLRDTEYIPYYYRDQAHYTSKGWLDVNEKIINKLMESNP